MTHQPDPNQPMPPQQPAPKRSWFARHKVLTTIGAVILFFIVVGIAAGDGEDSGGSGTVASEPEADAKAAEEESAEEPEKSPAEEFQDFVAKNGLPAEQEAVKHVTKIQGADEQNDILDSAEVYTDFTGGLTGEGQAPAKLIASAFADWKKSENGLVTVYDKDGELLANGNF